jgi:hypothetical protein
MYPSVLHKRGGGIFLENLISVVIFKYGKRFRFAPLFNKGMFVGIFLQKIREAPRLFGPLH